MPPSPGDEEEYLPDNDDLNWAYFTVQILRDGGYWNFLATGMLFRIDKIHRKLTLTNPTSRNRSVTNMIMYRRTVAVFKAIGYTVE